MLPELLEIMNLDYVWRFKFPATLVICDEDLPSEHMSRPNIQFLSESGVSKSKKGQFVVPIRGNPIFVKKLRSFAKFEPWSATTGGFVFPLSHQVYLPPTDTAEMF